MLVHKNLGYDYVRGGLILKYSSTSCAVTALLSNQLVKSQVELFSQGTMHSTTTKKAAKKHYHYSHLLCGSDSVTETPELGSC